MRNFCPTCQEICLDHPTMCTVCGDALVAPLSPASFSTRQSQHNTVRSNPLSVSFQGNTRNVVSDGGMWESVPEEAMDPQPQGSKTNPTSKQCLDLIPRITIDSHSAILHEATVQLQRTDDEGNHQETVVFDATVGEFPPHPPFHRMLYLYWMS